MDKDISTNILQDVLQIGHLDYRKTVDELVKITESKWAQFFEILYASSLTFTCKYSTTTEFVAGENYDYGDLPSEQYSIFHKSNIVAIICLSNQPVLDTMSLKVRQRIHDTICIGLVMGNLQDTKFSFVMSVCQSLSKIVTQVLQQFGKITTLQSPQDKRNYDIINSYLNQVISIIYDTIDYIEIDSEKIIMQNNLVDISPFVDETLAILSNRNINADLDDNISSSIYMDRERVQQMLISVLRKVSDLKDIRLHVSYADYSSSESSDIFILFRVFSNTNRDNVELIKRFQIEHVSVSSLDVFVVKRLCEIMKGTFEVTESGLLMKIKTDIPRQTDIFKGKRILIGSSDPNLSTTLINLFSELGATVTFLTTVNATGMLGISLDKFNLVIVDISFADFGKFAKKRGLPIVGILNNTVVSSVSVSMYDAILTIPVTAHEIKSKCEKLLKALSQAKPEAPA